MQVAPGLHRIEGTLGDRLFCQYLLTGELNVLVDTGINTTPEQTIFPYLRQVGLQPSDLHLAIITHADVDHFGGNHAVKQAAPRCLLAAHMADARWLESSEWILRERYGWYQQHGLGYPQEVEQWLGEVLGPDVPLDLLLQGDETLRMGGGRSVRILHLGGHSPGHLALFDYAQRAAIITDAALGRGLVDVQGRLIGPPPYFDIGPYLRGLSKLEALEPELLLTAHYPVMTKGEARQFLKESRAFVVRCREVVAQVLERSEGPVSLAEVTAQANERLGPFTAMSNELAGPVRAHLHEMMAAGKAKELRVEGRICWQKT